MRLVAVCGFGGGDARCCIADDFPAAGQPGVSKRAGGVGRTGLFAADRLCHSRKHDRREPWRPLSNLKANVRNT